MSCSMTSCSAVRCWYEVSNGAPVRSRNAFQGVAFVKLGRYNPVMRGEYWVYVLAGIISTATLMLFYLHDKPTELIRWW